MGKESMQNRKPMILVLAGPNGSGKSTITTFFDKVGKYTNADDVVATTGMNNMEAAVLVDRMRYESIAKKEDFTFETVLSSEHKLNILRKAKEEGYLYYQNYINYEIYNIVFRIFICFLYIRIYI